MATRRRRERYKWRPGPRPERWLDEIRHANEEDVQVKMAIDQLQAAGADPVTLGWLLLGVRGAPDGRLTRAEARRLVRDIDSLANRLNALLRKEIWLSDDEGNDRAALVAALVRFSPVLSDGRVDGRREEWTNNALQRLNDYVRSFAGGRPLDDAVTHLVNALLHDEDRISPRRRTRPVTGPVRQ